MTGLRQKDRKGERGRDFWQCVLAIVLVACRQKFGGTHSHGQTNWYGNGIITIPVLIMLTVIGGPLRCVCLRRYSVEGHLYRHVYKKNKRPKAEKPAYLGDGEEVDPALLLLHRAHEHRRAHQQEVRRPVAVHVQRAQGAAEVGADLKQSGEKSLQLTDGPQQQHDLHACFRSTLTDSSGRPVPRDRLGREEREVFACKIHFPCCTLAHCTFVHWLSIVVCCLSTGALPKYICGRCGLDDSLLSSDLVVVMIALQDVAAYNISK